MFVNCEKLVNEKYLANYIMSNIKNVLLNGTQLILNLIYKRIGFNQIDDHLLKHKDGYPLWYSIFQWLPIRRAIDDSVIIISQKPVIRESVLIIIVNEFLQGVVEENSTTSCCLLLYTHKVLLFTPGFSFTLGIKSS